MSDKPTFSSIAARWTRVALLAAIAIVVALLITTPHNEYPLTMSRAQANLVSAAPNYLVTTLNTANEHLYIIDKTKQVICVYTVVGDQFKLIAARKFDFDTGIVDGSIPIKGLNPDISFKKSGAPPGRFSVPMVAIPKSGGGTDDSLFRYAFVFKCL